MDLLLINLVVSWALVGLIWTIQLVQYPSFLFVDPQRWSAFHQHHTTNIAIVVMPLMVAELVLSSWLVYVNDFQCMYLMPFLLVMAIWASTFFWQVPLHHQLSIAKNDQIIKKLIRSNWLRTLLWTVKAVWVWYFFN